MALYTSTSTTTGLLPNDYGPLLIEPIKTAAVCLSPFVSTVISTGSHQFHVPVVNADVAASFVVEGAEITTSDPTISETVITPAKIAGLVIISRELADDSSPAAAQIVGNSLARAMAQQLDAAYFGNLASPSPAGLGSIATGSLNRVVAGVTPTTLDAFAQAISMVEQDGTEITAFVANPADALTVQTIKTGTGYAMPLLGTDATNGTARQILGIPLLVSAKVPAGNIWGVAAERNILVMRTGAQVALDASVFFTSDRVAVRGTMRISWAFTTPKSVAKIALAAS